VVADRLSAAVRRRLDEGGAAWLDRRGAAQLGKGPQALTPMVGAAPRVDDPLETEVGRDLALALLVEPHRRWGVRSLARHIDRSPGRVAELTGAMIDRGLVEADGLAPSEPHLFWALAARWRPRWYPAAEPAAGVVTGTLAAVGHGAPLTATVSTPHEIYVADRRALADHLARSTFERTGPGAPAYVAAAPSRQVLATAASEPLVIEGLRTVHAVVAALDLAQDQARGVELIGETWPQYVEDEH
jgi:hypothetical protein